jgi:hypothetical protein
MSRSWPPPFWASRSKFEVSTCAPSCECLSSRSFSPNSKKSQFSLFLTAVSSTPIPEVSRPSRSVDDHKDRRDAMTHRMLTLSRR